ncbi:MAG TPA: hypothetical protein VF372_00585 [Thermodesulfobacteriota bacterium]
MKSICIGMGILLMVFSFEGTGSGQMQSKFDLPEPYLNWEKAYLAEFPDLQRLMDAMISTTAEQLKKPGEDILHNRVCSSLAHEMAKNLPPKERRLAIATDILHNIAKEEPVAVLTDPGVFNYTAGMVKALQEAGYFKSSPRFWGDEAVLKNPKVGGNRALVHHLTGALKAAQIAGETGWFSQEEIRSMQAAIIQHSTGYWYFRAMVDSAAGKKDAWQAVFPEPESEIARIAHDADLISQFVPESVVPEGSKWRDLAKKRWGAKNKVEEGHIVYYVFLRLFEEAKTERGKELAREKWEQIRPELIKLMNLGPGQDPIKVLGIPKIFQ